MAEIQLTKGFVTIVDEEDHAELSRWKWYAHEGSPGRFYARRCVMERGLRVQVLMHNVIKPPPAGKRADHINRNPLDNRRENLRFATHQENMWNRALRRTKAPYRGVYPHRDKYQVSIRVDRQIYVGTFSDPIVAAHAYDKKARELLGEFAVLNFPGAS